MTTSKVNAKYIVIMSALTVSVYTRTNANVWWITSSNLIQQMYVKRSVKTAPTELVLSRTFANVWMVLA